MPFASALSEHPVATHAVGEVVGQVLDQLGEQPDVVVLFVTGGFAGAMDDIAGAVRALLCPDCLIGATAVSVLAGRQEVEGRAAIALFAMGIPRSPDRARHGPRSRVVRFDALPVGDTWGLSERTDLDVADATLVLLADPFTFPVEAFIEEAMADLPTVQIVGGLASAATGPGGNRLVADDVVSDRGAVGLLLPPEMGARTVVSQGCRPVGEPLVVTRASGNLIEEIAGQPALDRLMAQAQAARPGERNLMAQGLHIGLVIDESKPEFEAGDFLVRPVLGADHDRRAIAVGAEVSVGSTVQFQVRDAASADADLHHLLIDADAGVNAGAALVFTGNGRGTNLFHERHHDARTVADDLDIDAVAGMFCAGEIGPVGGRPFVHGFTASVLILSDPI